MQRDKSEAGKKFGGKKEEKKQVICFDFLIAPLNHGTEGQEFRVKGKKRVTNEKIYTCMFTSVPD